MHFIFTDQTLKYLKFLSGMYNWCVLKSIIDLKYTYYKSKNVVSTYSMPNREWLTLKYEYGVRVLL